MIRKILSVCSAVFALTTSVAVAGAVERVERVNQEGSHTRLPRPANFQPVKSVETPIEYVAPGLPRAPGDQHKRTLFLNRNGGLYMGNQVENRSSTNETSLITGNHLVPAYEGTDPEWQQVLTCTKMMYSRFNMAVTDVEPAGGDYIEVVFVRTSDDVGQPDAGWGGVAPSVPCENVYDDDAIVMVATAYWNLQQLCEVVAQESAHALGLDHELLCEDPMTYLEGCGAKTFQDQFADCHSNNVQPPVKTPCKCTNAEQQNSVQFLYDVLGEADAVPPTVTIDSPAAGATVPIGFVVEATATDNNQVSKVDLLLDGAFHAVDNASPWSVETLRTVAPGLHTIQLRAIDTAGNEAVSAEIQVNVSAECENDTDCPDGYACAGSICQGDWGSECEDNSDCASQLCAAVGNGKICTSLCEGPEAAECPSGTACEPTSGLGFSKCLPAGGGGGCEVAVSRNVHPLAWLSWLLVSGALLFLRSRRRS